MTLSRALVQAGRGPEGLAQAQAAVADHPGHLLLVAFELAIHAMVAPVPELEKQAWRLSEGADTPTFVWTVLSFVLARLGRREDALDIIDAALICSRTTTGEATLYAAPLAALGEEDRAAALLQRAFDERCGMLAMVLRDPAHAGWLGHHPVGVALVRSVLGTVPRAGDAVEVRLQRSSCSTIRGDLSSRGASAQGGVHDGPVASLFSRKRGAAWGA
eukprot:gene2474-3249_t